MAEWWGILGSRKGSLSHTGLGCPEGLSQLGALGKGWPAHCRVDEWNAPFSKTPGTPGADLSTPTSTSRAENALNRMGRGSQLQRNQALQ